MAKKVPTYEEVLARPADYVERQEEERKKGREQSHHLLREQVSKTMANLSDRERLVLNNLYGLEDGNPRTPTEVGRLIDRSVRTVRRIEKTAHKRLSPRSGQLKDYLQ